MAEATQIARTIEVVDFVQECPPAVLTSEMVPGPGGRLRLFTQRVQVPDADLWVRLTAEVKKGDTIQVTVRTIWPDEGRYYTVLAGFASQKASLEAAAFQRGSLEVVGSSS